jgi:perosamine synthetase
MLMTDRDDWAQLARSLRNHGRSETGPWLQHDRVGYNYRLDDLSAAVGLGQVRRLAELLRKRDAVAAHYNALLAGIGGITPLAPPRDGMRIGWFVYVVRIAPEINRDELMHALAARGIDSRPYFPPIHLQPAYRDRFGFREGMFPHAEAAGSSMLALPFHGNLSLADIEYVAACLAEEVGAAAP